MAYSAKLVAFALDHHIGPERKVMRHVAAVAIYRRRHLGDALLLQRPAGRFRLAHLGELESACRRKAQAPALRNEAGRIADRTHLDARLGAVHEAVEHFRVDRSTI